MMSYKSIIEILLRAIALVVVAFILLVGMQGCQMEEEVIIEPPEDEVMTRESPVFEMMSRMAMNDGSSDNILDKSSCTSIVLPVTVTINGIEITVDSEADFISIEKIFDQSTTDFDELSFDFPITVILADHSKITIENSEQLENIISGCVEGGADDDIECVDFIYPITISIYNSDNQVSDVKEINDDKEFHHFLHNVKGGDFIGINFPIRLLRPGGTEIVVNDIFELTDTIDELKDECDEDDDNDYNDDDVDDSDLIHVLLEGKWYISYYLDETDVAGQFNGFLFDFFENGTVVVYNDIIEIHGAWESSGDDGTLRLELFFEEHLLFETLNEDWMVLEFDGELIKLHDGGEDNASEKILKFERPDPSIEPELKVSDVLPSGQWVIARYEVSGEVKTDNYVDFELEFAEDGSVLATKGLDIIQGSWDEVIDGDVHKLVLDFGVAAVLFEGFNKEWTVVSVQESRVEVKHENGNDGSVDVLVFEKKG